MTGESAIRRVGLRAWNGQRKYPTWVKVAFTVGGPMASANAGRLPDYLQVAGLWLSIVLCSVGTVGLVIHGYRIAIHNLSCRKYPWLGYFFSDHWGAISLATVLVALLIGYAVYSLPRRAPEPPPVPEQLARMWADFPRMSAEQRGVWEVNLSPHETYHVNTAIHSDIATMTRMVAFYVHENVFEITKRLAKEGLQKL